MKEKHVQALGIALTLVYGVFVVWIYAAAPKSLAEVSVKARETVESVTSKGEITLGTYEVDKAKFAEGLTAFRADNFVLARDRFLRADPERADARTQFYIAYSYYRQGFGKVYNDDELFRKGLEEVGRVEQIDRDFRSDDADLKIRTAAELRDEFEEGLRTTADDFNPLKVMRERK